MEEGFDPSYSRQTRYAGGLGHAFARVLKFVSPEADYKVIPVMINTYYPPSPSPQRCVKFGQALARVLRQIPGQERVVIVGSGGLSHTKIDEDLDAGFIRALQQNDLGYMAQMPAADLVEGTSEIRNWIVTAGGGQWPRHHDLIIIRSTAPPPASAAPWALRYWDVA